LNKMHFLFAFFLVSFLLWDMWVVGVLCIAFRYIQWGFLVFCPWINASGCWGGMLPWFCLSIVLTCVFVGSSFGLWRWNACCLLPSCDCDLRWSTKIWRVRRYENSDCWTEVLRKFSKDQSFSNGLWEP
jgi:hypothetical protein